MKEKDYIADRGFEYKKNCIAAKNIDKFKKLKEKIEIDTKKKTHGDRVLNETPNFK
jgi:hypothetical protein